MVGVQQAQDFLSGFFRAITLKGLHVHSRGVSLAQARRELHLAVDELIVLDEPADETDDDYGRHRGPHGRGNRLCKASLGKRKDGPEGEDRSANQDTQSTKGGCADHVGGAFLESIIAGPAFHSVAGIVVANDVFVVVATLVLGTDRDHFARLPSTVGTGVIDFSWSNSASTLFQSF